MGKHTIDIGNFSNGMIPDVIGAADSFVDIVDGWIPRIGELRKRGGKTRYETLAAHIQMNAGGKVSTLSVNGNSPSIISGFAFAGYDEGDSKRARWIFRRSVDASSTAFARYYTTPTLDGGPTGWASIVSPEDQPIGGGMTMARFGDQLISPAPLTTYGGGQAGRWGGALDSVASTATGVTLTNGKTAVEGTFLAANFEEGHYITFGKAAGLVPNENAYYRIVRITSNNLLHIDRPWPGVTASDYSILNRYAVQRLGDPYETGIGSAQVMESHQDRVFGARFNPRFTVGEVVPGEDNDIPHDFTQELSRLRWSAEWSESGSGDGVTWTFPTTQDEDLCCYGENLWYPNAYVDVFPGQGGSITGLHSIGNSLVIVKEDAVFAMHGAVQSKGLPSGASIDVVSLESGTTSLRGSAKTEIGVAWANSRGLWIYNGSNTVNLVDKSISSVWNKTLSPSGETFEDCVVSGVNNRIIVQNAGGTIVYHTDKGYFARQTANPHTNIVAFGDASFGDVELAIDDTTGNIVDWSTDFTEDLDEDSENPDYPRLSFQTQPLPADKYPFFTARPHRIFVSGHFSVTMDVSILLGRSEFDEDFEVEDQVAPDDTKPLEYQVEAVDYDRTSEIRIGGVSSRPAHRFQFSHTDPAERMRLYGIGVEYLDDYTVGRDSDA